MEHTLRVGNYYWVDKERQVLILVLMGHTLEALFVGDIVVFDGLDNGTYSQSLDETMSLTELISLNPYSNGTYPLRLPYPSYSRNRLKRNCTVRLPLPSSWTVRAVVEQMQRMPLADSAFTRR